MQLDINDLYKLISESIQEVVRENFQCNLCPFVAFEDVEYKDEENISQKI